jgi:hypothetical protein
LLEKNGQGHQIWYVTKAIILPNIDPAMTDSESLAVCNDPATQPAHYPSDDACSSKAYSTNVRNEHVQLAHQWSSHRDMAMKLERKRGDMHMSTLNNLDMSIPEPGKVTE